tara:strand:- start:250 stop:411 length:162 start_codon:yes stop_codon:yes gene_type:complete
MQVILEKKAVFEKGIASEVVFLKEKQETLEVIKPHTNRSFKKNLRPTKNSICF